jgi:hypothetical protein
MQYINHPPRAQHRALAVAVAVVVQLAVAQHLPYHPIDNKTTTYQVKRSSRTTQRVESPDAAASVAPQQPTAFTPSSESSVSHARK